MTQQKQRKLTNNLYRRLEVAAATNEELCIWWIAYKKRVSVEVAALDRIQRIVAGIIKAVFDPAPDELLARYIFDTPASNYMAQAIAHKYSDIIEGHVAKYDATDFLYHIANKQEPTEASRYEPR